MSTIKYKTKYDSSIKPHEVIKETEKQITYKHYYTDIDGSECVKEERENKISNWHHWHDNFNDAKHFLLNRAYEKIAKFEKEIKKAKDDINIITDLKDVPNG